MLKNMKAGIKKYSLWQLLAFIVPIIGFMVVILWQVGIFDSLYYHHQNIRWNEEYATIPAWAI